MHISAHRDLDFSIMLLRVHACMCLCVREGENGGALACDGEGGRWWVKQSTAQHSKAKLGVT